MKQDTGDMLTYLMEAFYVRVYWFYNKFKLLRCSTGLNPFWGSDNILLLETWSTQLFKWISIYLLRTGSMLTYLMEARGFIGFYDKYNLLRWRCSSTDVSSLGLGLEPKADFSKSVNTFKNSKCSHMVN